MKLKVGGVPEHFNYPWIKLIQTNAFKHLGVELEWIDYPGGTGAMSQALEHDEIHLGIMLTEGSIKQIAEGKTFKILQKYIATPLNWGIYVNPSSPITAIQDLKNSVVAISRYGSGSHLMTYLLAKSQQWHESNLSFLEVNNLEGGVEAIQQNKASLFMWEHFTTKPHVENGIFRQIGTIPTPWPCFVIVVKETIASDLGNKLHSILKIVNQFSAQLKKDKNTVAKIAIMFSLKETDIKSWLKITEWSSQEFSNKEYKFVLETLKKTGIIKN